MYKKTSRMAIAAATVLALSLSAAAQAQTAGAAMPPADAHGGPGPHWHRHGGPEAVFERLHDQLGLNAQQEQQYQAAAATSKQNRQAMRRNVEQARSQLEAAQSQPILDLDALHSARQQVEQQNALLREQTERAWLAFYDGLNDQQKTTVSAALKQQFANMKARHEQRKARWQHHHASQATAASQ
ncbi:periplasmic heavy metal sensor [Burkholderia glumae]|uniref:periplasmic heavy metal sensor n=1 Tax=Burkholderia glumae TaxID=337 RepID=UPI000F5F2905|nr:periplasmic heavy metal sensor [Burkholderia glumae]MCQ0029307.1 periplasmic heavy metal sensor [Burkholderia glumae]MCQ0036896.1 periplasmic heavy metal sensor [Burkholderia glumae]MCR1766683.1 periplasmic heavy metal sensor [Burkholderia glumae]QHP90631.1 periplasmic heavy metal sensor [Burkholderia glumae]QJW79717.1 periplasmic heavy metal sensor [Burkholderia glumae]